MESVALFPEPLLIIGDFNFHKKNCGDPDLCHPYSMGLDQLVYAHDHELGHILDLFISSRSDSVVLDNPEFESLFFVTMLLSSVHWTQSNYVLKWQQSLTEHQISWCRHAQDQNYLISTLSKLNYWPEWVWLFLLKITVKDLWYTSYVSSS